MGLNTTSINNRILKNYMSQINEKGNNSITENDLKSLDSQDSVKKFAFDLILKEMMGSNESSGNLMMAQVLSSAVMGKSSFSEADYLGSIGNINSIMRSSNYSKVSPSKVYSKGIDNKPASLGLRASKYESNLDPAAISNNPGDYGGKSYGAWQFSSKTGSLDSFINSLKGKDNELYSKLSRAKTRDGNSFGENFDAAWKDTASSDRDGFLKLQQDYIKETFYDKVAHTLKSKFGFDINKKSDALKESLWSTVVQHGVSGGTSIFSKLNLKSSDANIINDLYNERQKVNIHFRSSSKQVQQSVYNRFTREKKDMLNMLNESFA